jgi:hypothetical protein
VTSLLMWQFCGIAFGQTNSNSYDRRFLFLFEVVRGVPQGGIVNVRARHCQALLSLPLNEIQKEIKKWCIEYSLTRYGTPEHLEFPEDIRLHFDIGGLCSREPAQWSEETNDNVSALPQYIGFHLEDAEDCTIELLQVSLVSGKPDPDLTNELESIQVNRDKQAAKDKAAAVAERKRQAEEAARKAAMRAAEHERVRKACAVIYTNTIDKKVRDLTVREEEQVRACQVAGMYPP